MQRQNWKDIAELTGIGAILVGLVFVYLELQQNGAVARAALTEGTSDQIDSIYQQMADPQFAEVYSKGLSSPEDLTAAERVQLHAFFNRFMPMFGRERILNRLGLWDTTNLLVGTFAPAFLSDGYGKIWWSVKKQSVSPGMLAAVDEAIANPIDTAQISVSEFDRQVLRILDQR